MRDVGFLFDMDGVLADTNPFHRRAIIEFCRARGVEVTENLLREKVFGRINREWIPAVFGPMTMDTCDRLAAEKEQHFRDLYAPHMQPVDGLVAFLETMSDAGIPAVLATSAPDENASFILDGFQIRRHFQAVLSSRHVAVGKPDPEIYLLSANHLDLPPERCIVFEDSLAGVAAGKRAGCPVVGLSTTHDLDELAQADLVVPDFTQILPGPLCKLIIQPE